MTDVKEKFVYWAALPLRTQSSRMAALMNPIYSDALKKNVTAEMFKEFKIIAQSKHMNLVMSCFGPQRWGKSYTVIYIAEKYSKYKQVPLSIDNWAFTITNFNKVVENLSRGEIAGLDEQIYTSGYGSAIEKMMLSNIEMTIGKSEISMFFIAPKFIKHNFHYFIETWQMGSEIPWDWTRPIEEQWKYTRSIIYDHRGYMLGYIVTSTPTDAGFLAEYEKRKDKFVAEAQKGLGSQRYTIVLDKAYELLEQEDFLQRFIQCPTSRLQYLLTRVALKGYMMSITETRILIDYINYILEWEPEFKAKKDKILDSNPRTRKGRKPRRETVSEDQDYLEYL